MPSGTLWFTDYVQILGTQLNGLSQANMYGDDCAAATNYPIVQLTNTDTGRVVYARTYDFSTMGVATGSSLQSAKFDASRIPSGSYNLRVIANGIASQPVGYFQQGKPQILDTGNVKREFDILGKEIYEGDPYKWWEEVVDPEIVELQAQVKQLQNTVRRLNSLIPARELPQVGKEVKSRVAADGHDGHGEVNQEDMAEELFEEMITEER
jgi:hypothetical protein